MFVVELVKAGSLGFAVACLVLSYSLLKKIMNSNEFEGKSLEVRCKEIRIFMCVSVLVIVIGITGEIAGKMLVPEINVRLDITPEGIAQDLVVKAGGKKIDIKGDDVQIVPMRDRDEMSVGLGKLENKLADLERQIQSLKASSEGANNQLTIMKKHQAQEALQSAASTEEAGI